MFRFPARMLFAVWLVVISAAALRPAFSEEYGPWAVQLNLASYHPGASEDYNEFNRGIGVEYHLPKYYLTGGYFWNSLYRHSFYAGAGKEFPLVADSFGAGLIGGAVTGYRSGQRPYPALIPYLYYTYERFTFKVHYLPEVGDVDDDAFGFALRIQLD